MDGNIIRLNLMSIKKGFGVCRRTTYALFMEMGTGKTKTTITILLPIFKKTYRFCLLWHLNLYICGRMR